jgi:hypothetical protein
LSMSELLDSLLTFIERREAEQVQYGLYDVLLTGDELLTAFSSEPEQQVRAALSGLWQRGLIVRFEDNADHCQWVFRSRTAETVRLVSKLRQRVVRDVVQQRRHRADRSPRLVHDLKFEIRPRQVPDRNLPMSDLVAPLRQGQDQALAQAAGILEALFPHPEFQFSGFQRRAFQAIADHILLKPRRSSVGGLVITASTGSGKTYAFFLPVLAYCIAEKGMRDQHGVKAICLYPRVALSENQLEDFVRLIYQVNQHLPADRAITVGIDSGASPYRLSDFTRSDDERLQRMRGWHWDADTSRYICPFARCPVPDCEGELAVQQTQPDRIFCTSCGRANPFILYTKEQLRTAPPDVLVATTESLNDRLMNSEYQMLFGDANTPPPAVVMLDEIHLQSSTKGTQIALLLRRLAARIRRGAEGHSPRPNLMLVGLSATIAQPKAFFTDLTGLTLSAIAVVEPVEESEMVTAGAERYLFARAGQEEDTAVISTLLQTAMAVVHSMPLPSPEEQAESIAKYKTFGFAQSLDIVGRWFYQLADAEKVNPDDVGARAGLPAERWPIAHTPLYWYRAPGHNRRLFPDFFGRGLGGSPCPCPQRGYPDLDCIYFQEGECWWLLCQGLENPMRVKRKTASDRQTRIELDDDLIITTTALEVGYDDATLMGVIQYQAPANVASFVQRKGRGGRKVGTRPFITTVLSPYKTADVFLYQNHHLLVEPRFKKLPLNPANPFLQRIHGFYALFDWLAYLAARQDLQLALSDYMCRHDYDALKQLTARPEILDAFRDYLADMFNLQDPARMQMLLVDPESYAWNYSGILTRGLGTLMDALHDSFDEGHGGSVRARREVLRDYLPQNLFSDINLPELDVWYGHRREPVPEEISLGISETIPGNVTFRRGGGSSWIAPPLGAGQIFTLEDAYTLSSERRHETIIERTDLPYRIGQLMQAQGRLPRAFRMIRPTAVMLRQFGDRDGSQWWFDGTNKPGGLFHVPAGRTEPTGQNIRQVRHASGAYPVGFTQVEPPRMVGRRFSFDVRDGGPLFNDLGRALFTRIDFASDADNGRLMKVRRVIVGSQYSLKLVGEDEPLEGVTAFARRDAPDELTAIGYEMQTEGITFTLSDLPTGGLTASDETTARLQRNFVKHAVVTELTTRSDVNYFAAERFAEVMLTVADLLVYGNDLPLDRFRNACRGGEDEVRGAFSGMINRVYHLSRKNTQAVIELLGQPEVRACFADRYAEIHNQESLYSCYLEDTFVHTLKHVLKQAAQRLAGVEAMQYVSAYTPLNIDFGELRDRPIWLYELGLGGVGVLRSVQGVLRDDPARFWRVFDSIVGICETEAEDRFLLDVLNQPEHALDALHALVGGVRVAASFAERQAALRDLRDGFRQMCGLLPNRDQIRLLLKLFSDDYTGRGIGLRNWRLYRELNVLWVPAVSDRLGRLPTQTEARGLMHYDLTRRDAQRCAQARTVYPELARLLELYQREYTGNDVRRIFENAIGRRLLLNCRDACPTCLDEGPACQIDPPGLSALTLSRALVSEILWRIRQARTVTCADGTRVADLSRQIEMLFQQDLGSPVIVAASIEQPGVLAALLSHLTDYGVVDRLERRYPRVERVRTVNDQLHVWLTLALEGEA